MCVKTDSCHLAQMKPGIIFWQNMCGSFSADQGRTEHRTFSPYEWLSKAKMQPNASYFLRKCDDLEQNGLYFWINTPELVRKKYLIPFSKYVTGQIWNNANSMFILTLFRLVLQVRWGRFPLKYLLHPQFPQWLLPSPPPAAE